MPRLTTLIKRPADLTDLGHRFLAVLLMKSGLGFNPVKVCVVHGVCMMYDSVGKSGPFFSVLKRVTPYLICLFLRRDLSWCGWVWRTDALWRCRDICQEDLCFVVETVAIVLWG